MGPAARPFGPANAAKEGQRYMAEHAVQGLMGVTMEKIREMVDSDTIIGKPIKIDGITILPISKVTFGFASGGSDFGASSQKDLFGGGGGAGVTIQPVAFLVVQDGTVRTVQLADAGNTVDRAITMMPEMMDKVSSLLKKDKPQNGPEPAGAAQEG